MGKTSRRSRKRKSQSFKIAAEFSRRVQDRHVSDLLANEQYKAQQSRHAKNLEERVRQVLARTVYINNVRDLNNPDNLDELRRWLERDFGSVVTCERTRPRNRKKNLRYPPARVQFMSQESVERLLGRHYREDGQSPTLVECPFGMKREGLRSFVSVQPSTDPTGLLEQENVVGIETQSLSIGHWFPWETDLVGLSIDYSATEEADEWVTEQWTALKPYLEINLAKREIMLTVSPRDSVQVSAAPSPSGGDVSIEELMKSMLTAPMLVNPDFLALHFERSETAIKEHATYRFKSLDSFIELCVDEDGSYSIIMALKHAPVLQAVSESSTGYINTERIVEFGGIPAATFGLGYAVKLGVSRASALQLLGDRQKLRQLKSSGIFRGDLSSHHDAKPIHSVDVGSCRRRFDAGVQKLYGLSEKIGLLLRALVDNGRSSIYHCLTDSSNANGTLVDVLAELLRQPSSSSRVAEVLGRILAMTGSTRFPLRLFELVMSSDYPSSDRAAPDYCVLIPRISLSPCRSRFQGYEMEQSNRIVRKYVNERGYSPETFLRVQMVDEAGNKMFPQHLSEAVVKLLSVQACLLSINGRIYEFLNFSSSQAKETSFWMVCRDNGLTAIEIRRDAGDFSKCLTPSKLAARMGQCFSTTVQGLSTRTDLCEQQIADLESRSGGKVFSDGCGMISRDKMDDLVARMPNPPKQSQDVGIVQIRFGGIKGTLVAWDRSMMPRSADVCFRPSMLKFEAPRTHLEVCKIGSRVPYYLNRFVILLLGAHGVPDQTFLDMQSAMIDELDAMLVSRASALALLPRLSGIDNECRVTLLRMLHSGMCPSREPFLYAALRQIRTHHLQGLRKKSRILVKEGAVLMGGIDETGLLPDGCVFLQVAKPNQEYPGTGHPVCEPVVGPVLVTKHPAVHKGDVRMLFAVDLPELRGLRNVLIFSQHGSRPETDKMGGSDLDGDEYAVTWDSRLFLHEWRLCRRVDNHWLSGEHVASTILLSMDSMAESARLLTACNAEPLSYDAPDGTPAELSGDESQHSAQLVKYLFDFARNDILGAVCMLWLDWAAEGGADCPQCVKLAQIHSVAVDFAKSGVAAKLPKELRWPTNKPRPHWKEKKYAENYQCRSSVGLLYDQLTHRMAEQPTEIPIAVAGREIDKYGTILTMLSDPGQRSKGLDQVYDTRIPLLLGQFGSDTELDEWLHEVATESRWYYDNDVLALMGKFGIRSEAEVYTGCIRKFHKLYKKRQHELSTTVQREYREIVRRHRRFFLEIVLDLADPLLWERLSSDETNDETRVELEAILTSLEPVLAGCTTPVPDDSFRGRVKTMANKLAAAYYNATYNPSFVDGRARQVLLLFGFPWIVADVICSSYFVEANVAAAKTV